MEKAGLVVFSPPRRNYSDKENHVPTLSFTMFSKPPVVSFGTVKVGSSKSALLQIENPPEDVVSVKVMEIAPDKGFSIDRSEFTVQPKNVFTLNITWTPVKGGRVRELVYFHTSGPRKYQAVLLGTAEAPHKKKRSLWNKLKSGSESGKIGRRQKKPGVSPSVLCPTVKPENSGNVSSRSDTLGRNPENKGGSKMPNRTVVPLGGQERLMSLKLSVQSEKLPLSTLSSKTTEIQVPSLKEALSAIQSDLSTSSNCDFSDSLELDSGAHGLPDSPQLVNINEQRLTFFVGQTDLGSKAKRENAKMRFPSATVIKGKAPLEVDANSQSERRVKKSRRRLLDKTLELSSSSNAANCSQAHSPSLPVIAKTLELSFSSNAANCSRTHSPSLPVIDSAWGVTSSDGHQVELASPSSLTPQQETFFISAPVEPPNDLFGSSSSPAPSTIPLPLNSSSPLQTTMFMDSKTQQQTATVSECSLVKEDLSPFRFVLNTKKRKSEEHLSSDQNVGKMFRGAQLDTQQSVQEKRRMTLQQKKAVSVCSTSSRKISQSRVPTQAKQSSSTATSRGTRSVKRSKVVAVAQSKLTFIKPVKTALPRHPMPFASNNMFYDERWMEKQERGFTWWLNYVLTPDDFKVNSEVNKDAAVCLAMTGKAHVNVPEAPTKEEVSFSTYTAQRKLNHLRRAAYQIFMSDAMVKAIRRLEVEVEAGRLRVRPDRHLWKDIGERKKVLSWLLSYNPLWLRIGLETIYGEMISLRSNSDTLGLAMFILQRLLWNPDIAAKFKHPSVSHLYKDGHEETLSRFTLKKLLLLVCFLDKAKESRLIEHNPCLFCIDAEFKTSKDLLLAFSRDFLSGEGILSRHLSFLGLPVSHSQKPLDEFNFAVKNLAVDLRCGVRLVRVMELFLQDWSFSEKLRVPTVSRLQKVHNVGIALQALQSKGVDLKDERGSTIEARDIVDGHREKTLGLLWKILLAFHLEVILNEDELREETRFLKDTIRTKQKLASLRTDQRFEPGPAEKTTSFKHSSRKIILLMDWVCAVCDFYRLKVDNFTVAFSDGRVLCYLIHHYHPGLLPAAAISHSTTQTVECSLEGRLELDHSASDPDASSDSLPTGLTGPDSQLLEFHNLLKNERNNFKGFNTAVAYLGGVPAMINPADMSNTIPDEKVVISYLSFLCARLLDLCKESRAARVIQCAWRKYKLRQELQLYKERNDAAIKIQKVVRSFMWRRRAERRSRAAVIIQSLWRGHAARNRMRLEREAQLRAVQHEAAMIIQVAYRSYAALRDMRVRTELKRQHQAATVIQSKVRMFLCKKKFLLFQSAAAAIQSRYRAILLCRAEQKKFTELKKSAVKIQAAFRGSRVRQNLRMRHNAATVIQARFRMYRTHTAYQALKCAAICIQHRYRAKVLKIKQIQMHKAKECAAVVIQAAYRGHQVRRRLAEMHQAATLIQRKFVTIRERRRFLAVKAAALVCQRRYRASTLAKQERLEYLSKLKAVVCLQAAYRGFKVRKQLRIKQAAAVTIQSHFRTYQQRRNYLRLRWASSVLQERYRANIQMKADMHSLSIKKNAAVVLQAAFRGTKTRQILKQRHQAATVIQRAHRAFCERERYLRLKSSILTVQRRYRATVAMKKQRKVYRQTIRAVTVLQSVYRGHLVRKEVARQHHAATVIQSALRKHREFIKFQAMRLSAIIIQRRYRSYFLELQQREKVQAESRLRFISAVFHHLSAIKIQRAVRAHLALKSAKRHIHCIVVIQRWVRARQQRQRFLGDREKVVQLQRAVRSWLSRRRKAATIIQRTFRRFLLIRRQKRAQQGIIKAQALWRGHRSRRLNDNPKLVALRHRLHQITAAAREEHKLINKTLYALDILLHYKQVSSILEALKNLESATRLSPECCQQLLDSRVTQVIFTLIRKCNRSVPGSEIIAFSIQILLNLSKYHKTINMVYSVENSVETLLDLLQRYRHMAGNKAAGKGSCIFTKTCFILTILLQDHSHAQEIMKQPKAMDRVRSIYHLTVDKNKMNKEVKHKMPTSVNTCAATSHKSHPQRRFAPDWVLRRDKLEDIDSFGAIQMVAQALSLK